MIKRYCDICGKDDFKTTMINKGKLTLPSDIIYRVFIKECSCAINKEKKEIQKEICPMCYNDLINKFKVKVSL